MKKTENNDTLLNITIPAITLNTITLRVVGDSPLIVHNWSKKAKQEMLDKQMKKASTGKKAKVPAADFIESLYWLDENNFEIGVPESLQNITNDTPYEDIMAEVVKGRFGFKSCAFKASAIDAGYQQGILAKKTTARGAFHIIGDFVKIEGIPEMREDMVKIAMGTSDIRYRAEFKTWSAELTIRYNPVAISAEQIINLLNYGGFANGVGEWRPSKDGSFGTFHVETA